MYRSIKKGWICQLTFVCCLSTLLIACGKPAAETAAATTGSVERKTVVAKSSMVETVETQAMPPTETSCPAEGTARAAVMRPLRLGETPTAVYVFNDVPPNTTIAYGRLMRVDVGSKQSTEIVNSGLSIQWAQVSTDGQWVLFLSQPDPRGDRLHSGMLQLVRLDGQGLQTLYCLPNNTNDAGQTIPIPSRLQWSEDQKSVLISSYKGSTSVFTLLSLATGQLKTLLKISDTQQLYYYSLLFWLDNERAYILKEGLEGPPPPVTLYLFNIETSHDIQGGDLQKILDSPVRFRNLSFDSSYDGKQLFFANCLQVANPFDQTIQVGPASGGTFKTIYHQAQSVCVNALRVGSGKKLLMSGVQTDPQGQSFANYIWTMEPDGSDWKPIFALPKPQSQAESFSLNTYSQFPWSDFARSGQEFTFLQKNQDTGFQRLWFEPLAGGQPHVLASTPANSTASSLDMVGWTSY